jgi:hypothetical protein
MNSNSNQRVPLWLAGWYTIPGEQVQFVSRYQSTASPWLEASAWLREELRVSAERWGPSECQSLHVDTGAVMGDLVFAHSWDFIEWACQHRQDRGIWGRDSERCYYLIVADSGTDLLGAVPAPVPDTTAPLMVRSGEMATLHAEDLGSGLKVDEHGRVGVTISPS